MNPWITHVKQYQNANNCSYREALKGASKTYQKQKGGNKSTTADITRGTVGVLRYGMQKTPFNALFKHTLDPLLSKGLDELNDWEHGIRGIDKMSHQQRVAYGQRHATKATGSQRRR